MVSQQWCHLETVFISVLKVALTAYFIDKVSKTEQNVTDTIVDQERVPEFTVLSVLSIMAELIMCQVLYAYLISEVTKLTKLISADLTGPHGNSVQN